jgi:hypothetical protein
MKNRKNGSKEGQGGESPSQVIDASIKELGAWRGEDPSVLFNASLEGNTRRAIDLREGDEIDEEALKGLVRAAVALNTVSGNA